MENKEKLKEISNELRQIADSIDLLIDNEIWKNIDGYEGLYQISNKGRVRNIRINYLKGVPDKDGNIRVHLSKNNSGKKHKIKRLVAQAFLPNPENYPNVININGDKTNCNLNNIEWNNPRAKEYEDRINEATQNGISYKDFASRIKNGWTVDEAISIKKIPRGKNIIPKMYKYNGEWKTVTQLARDNNISEFVIYNRLRRGWSINEAVEIPVRKRGEK